MNKQPLSYIKLRNCEKQLKHLLTYLKAFSFDTPQSINVRNRDKCTNQKFKPKCFMFPTPISLWDTAGRPKELIESKQKTNSFYLHRTGLSVLMWTDSKASKCFVCCRMLCYFTDEKVFYYVQRFFRNCSQFWLQ